MQQTKPVYQSNKSEIQLLVRQRKFTTDYELQVQTTINDVVHRHLTRL